MSYFERQPNDNCGYLMLKLSHLKQRKVNALLRPYNLTGPQFQLITAINRLLSNKEEINQKDIIEFTKMDKTVVSNVLRLLEKKDIITRTVNEKDTRAKNINLTEHGIKTFENLAFIVEEEETKMFEVLGDEYKVLQELLLKLVEANS